MPPPMIATCGLDPPSAGAGAVSSSVMLNAASSAIAATLTIASSMRMREVSNIERCLVLNGKTWIGDDSNANGCTTAKPVGSLPRTQWQRSAPFQELAVSLCAAVKTHHIASPQCHSHCILRFAGCAVQATKPCFPRFPESLHQALCRNETGSLITTHTVHLQSSAAPRRSCISQPCSLPVAIAGRTEPFELISISKSILSRL